MSLFADEPSLPGISGAAPADAAPAYRVLARKWRPKTFADLIGQDVLVRILRNAFAMNRVPHALMLTGVRGVGKTTTARIVARCLNCVGADGQGGPTAEPCGTCPNCTAILADRHPDVTEMDAASRTGVDDVREIIEATRFRPMQARRRVFIIDEVHMLSKNAFNALLKTLEEPPPHVTFIFATTEIRKVPVTVLSRCMRFDLRRVSVRELTAHFGRIAEAERVTVEPEALALLSRAADGSVRDGLSLLDQAIAQASEGAPVTAAAVSEMLGLADRQAAFDLLEAVLGGRTAEALAITERAHEYGADLGVILVDLLDLLHTLTRLKTVPTLRETSELPEAERVRGAAIADRVDMATLGRAWQMLLKGIGEVEAAPDRRAAGEMILVRLCYVAELPTPGELVRQLAETPQGAGGGGGGGARMAAGGSRPTPVAAAEAPLPASPAPAFAPALAAAPARAAKPQNLREVAALLAERREPSLHAHLMHSVHLVRFAPPVIELRPEPEAPRDFAQKLASVLLAATGQRWTIAVSAEPGDPTLWGQDEAAHNARRHAAAEHPLVRSILDAFPGARVEPVRMPAPAAETSPPSTAGLQDDETIISDEE
jgi:DNA polymerase-3 subunit gamma/tau